MLKRSVVILWLICISAFLSGCVSDWIYELPHDYAISNNAYATIELVKITSRYRDSCTLDIVVETYVNEFSYNEHYVAVKHFDPEKLDFENFNSNDFSNPSYYLVDTVSTNMYGPYETEAAFETACLELNVGELSEWICTKSNPNKTQETQGDGSLVLADD